MEIYSYVGNSFTSEKRKISFTGFSFPGLKKDGFRKPKVYADFGYAEGKINWKLFVKKIGEHIGLICIIIASVLFLTASVFGYSVLSTWLENHTNPLNIQSSYEEDLERLDRQMAAFASESTEEADADGNLEGVVDLKLLQGPVTFETYTVKQGETIGSITRKAGLQNISTIIAVNNISNVRTVYSGQKLTVPSCDGLFHKVVSGNTIQGISTKYQVPVEDILDANDLDSEVLQEGMKLFIPGARLDRDTLKKAMGDTWQSPLNVKWRLTSVFGYRGDPFTGVRQYHNGYDMACDSGSPIFAALDGKVVFSGWSNLYGNYIIIDHGNGYQTLYGHMLKRISSVGQRVSRGEKIGLVGSTGYSTGPHLHFTVYKNGKPVDPKSVVKSI